MPHYIYCDCGILTWYSKVLRFMIQWDRLINQSQHQIHYQYKTAIWFQVLMK